MEALLLARLLKDVEDLPEVLVRSLAFIMGAEAAQTLHYSSPVIS